MPQLTNLNTFPYFDDFDPNKGYHKVLFKPGQPVQARELTTIQSIIQDQIEKFGNHVFKDGSVVIPGGVYLRTSSYNVSLENTFNGIDLLQYIEGLNGKILIGEDSGVKVKVEQVSGYNLFLNVLKTGSDKSTNSLIVGERLLTEETLSLTDFSITNIQQNQPVAIVKKNQYGCIVSVKGGVFFIRGYFVNVEDSSLVVSLSNPAPSFIFGFDVKESFVDSYDDPSLFDNAQGFSNYSAPGADRFKIEVDTKSYPIEDTSYSNPDKNFIELIKVINGTISSSKIDNPEYNVLANEFARRTFDESGDYYVKPFTLDVKDSLNNLEGNGGIFTEDEITNFGFEPSDDIGVYRLSSGKAYVRGFEVDIPSSTLIDFKKPRTTKLLTKQDISYSTGPTFTVNRIYGVPNIGISTTYYIGLRDRRVGADSTVASGKEIGVARVYDIALESGSYNSSNTNLNEWDISLYDIQTFTDISVNQNLNTVQVPTFIKGKSSGAVGFLRYDVSNSGILTAYNVRGNFIKGEELIFDGIDSERIVTSSTNYGLSDVKSLYASDSSGNIFSGDVKQSVILDLNACSISASSGNISTITQPGRDFSSDFKVNDLITFNQSSESDPNIARVSSVEEESLKISPLTSVSGIFVGTLPVTQIDSTIVKKLTSKLQQSQSTSLFTTLPKANISTVSLNEAQLTIRKTFEVTITSGRIDILPSSLETGETFLPFDEERYILINSNGATEVLTSDKFTITSGGRELIIKGLEVDGSATLVASLKKINIKSKKKIRNKVSTIVLDKSKYIGSGIGSTTINDGLEYGNYPYGTRVQDEEICLLYPDVTKLHAVYESSTNADPEGPVITISNVSSLNSSAFDVLDGEKLVGETSECVALVVRKISSTNLEVVFINDKKFINGENISFKESLITATVDSSTSGDNNIIGRYILKSFCKETIYDYSRIIRKSSLREPTKKLKVVFERATINSTDEGSIVTVDSYNDFNYCDILKTNGIRHSDILDIRPRVSKYTISENARSPFEFFGRNFVSTENSNTDILASDESIVIDYSFYLPRIDKIFLSKQKVLQLISGVPSENPRPPLPINNAIEVATITLPPYLCNVSDAVISLRRYKRYQMRDIARLENRIKNLEYYTTLSLLETNTSNLSIKDSNGLERFKSGFYVDNFSSTGNQKKITEVKNSIDRKNHELRPSSYTTELDLVLGSTSLTGVNGSIDTNADPKYVNDLIGENVRRSTLLSDGTINRNSNGMGTLTLDYTDTILVSQESATRVENAAPYFVNFYTGTITLNPSSDIWVDQVRVETQTIEGLIGDFQVENVEITRDDFDPQSGWDPVEWGGWEDNWTGRTVIPNEPEVRQVTRTLPAQPGGTDGSRTTTTTTFTETIIETGTSTRSGITERLETVPGDEINLGDKLISSDVAAFMRSRNIEIDAKAMKPNTRLYGFFEQSNVTKYIVPKLLEIEMLSGTFSVGELIEGGDLPTIINNSPYISFRTATLNHRNGIFDNPDDIYTENPYTNEELGSTYSTTSTILNVDTASLSIHASGDFFGYIEQGMILQGKTSGARARITNLRLISDNTGRFTGSFFIPNPNATGSPKFKTGISTFILRDTSNNSNLTNVGGVSQTSAEENYFSSGSIDNVQGQVISTRNLQLTRATVIESRSIQNQETVVIDVDVDVEIIEPINPPPPPPPPAPPAPPPVPPAPPQPPAPPAPQAPPAPPQNRRCDPLAQSFFVGSSKDETGCFITGVTLYFRTTGTPDETIYVELRPMVNGLPTFEAYPLSHVVLRGNQINTSEDGSIGTFISFPAPVYVEGNKEHSIVVGSNQTSFTLWISRQGEVDVRDLSLPESEQVPIVKQSNLGSLFKSQNGSTWTPSQYEDLKFILYRANFSPEGRISFFNPDLSVGNNQIAILKKDSLEITSKKIRVGLGTTVSSVDAIEPGNTVVQDDSNAQANYVGGAGIATGNLNIINSGIGLTPSLGYYTYDDVNLTVITGSGQNGTADITVEDGVAIAATVTSGGNGYRVGDILTGTIGNDGLGRNLQLSISELYGINEIILDQVQGDFIVGTGKTIRFINSSGVTTDFSENSSVFISNTPRVITDGLHIKVNHLNHGMHSGTNTATLNNISSDIIPAKISTSYSRTSTADITLDDASNFTNFEGVGVAVTNPGYALIGKEIISYTAVSGNTLENITRSIDSTFAEEYDANQLIYKYEFSGISLRRINKDHQLQDATVTDPIGLDYYTIKIDNSSDGIDRSNSTSFPTLYLNETKSSGGDQITSNQNIQYEIMKPLIQTLVMDKTSLRGRCRTVTATSVSGNETSFIDSGYQNISLDQNNYFDTPRMIASNKNSEVLLTDLPGNKSFEIELTLSTSDRRLSPVIDLDRVGSIFISNRVNKVINDYKTDIRTSSIQDDPNAFVYVTKPIALEIPGNNIRTLLSAYVNEFSDIRAFYAILNNPDDDPIYYPFPGYTNRIASGQVIDINDNDGSSDSFVSPVDNKGFLSRSLVFKDYEFTVESLPSFKYFSIKVIGTSTNQCYPPRMRDFRTIAYA